MESSKKITKIIAFGGGSFENNFAWDPDNILIRYVQLNFKAAHHLVVQDVRTIIEQIRRQEEPDPKVETFVQDEVYTEKDREKLTELQFEPLVDPDDYRQIDQNTLVFCFGTNNAFMQVIADNVESTPPAMIFHRKIEIEEWEDYKPVHRGQRPPKGYLMDSTSPRVQALIQKYEEVDVNLRYRYPRDPDVLFYDVRLYVLKGLGQARPPEQSSY